MNNQIDNLLAKLKEGQIQTPKLHQQQLKSALLCYASKHSSSAVEQISQGTKNMFKTTKPSTFLLGAASALALVAIVFASNHSSFVSRAVPGIISEHNPLTTARAQAEALAQDTLQNVQQLSPEQLQDLNNKTKTDMLTALHEALNAPDLSYVDPNAIETNPNVSGRQTLSPYDPNALPVAIYKANSENGFATEDVAKMLRYTDSRGHIIRLAIDKNNLPLFESIWLTEEQAKDLQTRGLDAIQ